MIGHSDYLLVLLLWHDQSKIAINLNRHDFKLIFVIASLGANSVFKTLKLAFSVGSAFQRKLIAFGVILFL